MNKKLLLVMLVMSNSLYSEEKIILEQISTNNEVKLNLDVPYEEQSLITPGRITLKNNGGYIYSIVDPIPTDSKLSIQANKKQNIEIGLIEFYVYSNYQEIIKKWELLIYEEEDVHRLDPIGKIEGTELLLNKPIIFNFNKNSVKEGDKYYYTLKVYDKDGRFDQTDVYPLEFTTPINATKNVDLANKVYGNDDVIVRNIQFKGSKVRVYGKDL